MAQNRTIEIDLDVYVGMLENRREQITPRGWTIPNGVWEFFVDILEDCGINTEHSDPSYIVDNLALNGDYGPCEDYLEIDDILAEIDEVFDDRDTAVRDAAERYVEECGGFFIYDDPDSEYGTGICMSL